jgi:hypothetical protein
VVRIEPKSAVLTAFALGLQFFAEVTAGAETKFSTGPAKRLANFCGRPEDRFSPILKERK